MLMESIYCKTEARLAMLALIGRPSQESEKMHILCLMLSAHCEGREGRRCACGKGTRAEKGETKRWP